MAIGVLILGLFPQIIEFIAFKLGIDYPPILTVVAAIVAIVWLVFYISSELAIAQAKIRELAMQISILNHEMFLLKSHETDIEQKWKI